MKRIRAAVALLIVGVLTTVVGAGPAAATGTGITYSDPVQWTAESSRFGLDAFLSSNGFWIQCRGVAYWETNMGLINGTQTIKIQGACASGVAVFGGIHKGVWWVDPEGPTCDRAQSSTDDAEDGPIEFSGIYTMPITSDGCGPVTQICWESDPGNDDPDFCVPLGAAPDPFQDPEAIVGEPDTAGCSSMEGVSDFPRVKLIGPPELRTRVIGSGPTAIYEAQYVQVFEAKAPAGASTGSWRAALWFAGPSPGSGSLNAAYVHADETTTGTPASSTNSLGTFFRALAPASGTVPADGVMRRYVAKVSPVASSTGSAPTPPTEPTIEGVQVWDQGGSTTTSVYNGTPPATPWGRGSFGSNTGGLTVPGACLWYWGVKIAPTAIGDPVGDVPVGDPPPLVVEDPPTVFVGPTDECPPDTLVCVDPVSDDPDNPNDQPDDEDPGPTPDEEAACGSFSITDPSTWVGATVCVLIKILGALVDMAKKLGGLLARIVSLLLGLMDDLLDLFMTLFVPDPASWDFAGLMDQVQTRAPFSLFGPLGDGLGEVAASYHDSGCDTLGGFAISGEDVNISCNAFTQFPGAAALRTLVAAGLVGVTMIYIWNLLSSLVSRSES